jgi:hypothetical protein
MSEFVQGIKNFIALVLIGGSLFAVIIIWNGTAPVYDALTSSNMTWAASGNITQYQTSETIAQSWKYLMFLIPVGGLIAMAVFVMRRKGGQ